MFSVSAGVCLGHSNILLMTAQNGDPRQVQSSDSVLSTFLHDGQGSPSLSSVANWVPQCWQCKDILYSLQEITVRLEDTILEFLCKILAYTTEMDVRELARSEWPQQLLEIPQPPKKLWVRGKMPPSGTKLLTVVGSRAMTRYGEEACQKLITGLAGYPISIVSGLALGTDTCAHKTALAAGLHTLVVPGSGLGDEVLYPRSNRIFAQEILKKGGGFLSEYPADALSRVHFFPERNRIMVGLSDAVLIIEAGQKSGTLITARLASEYNRDLLCIPHRIGDPHSFGGHLFIRLGAALVTEPLHILEALKIPPRETGVAGAAPSDLEDAELVIWNMLDEPKTRDEILRGADGNIGELMTALVSLELRGLTKEEFGAWHRA